MMTVVHAHKGAQIYVTKFTGFEAHSSMTHLGVSAIHFAGEFVHYLNQVQDELDAKAPNDQRVHAGRPRPSMSAPSSAARRATSWRASARCCGAIASCPAQPLDGWASAPSNGWRKSCCPR